MWLLLLLHPAVGEDVTVLTTSPSAADSSNMSMTIAPSMNSTMDGSMLAPELDEPTPAPTFVENEISLFNPYIRFVKEPYRSGVAHIQEYVASLLELVLRSSKRYLT